jgi:hypothetical protein
LFFISRYPGLAPIPSAPRGQTQSLLGLLLFKKDPKPACYSPASGWPVYYSTALSSFSSILRVAFLWRAVSIDRYSPRCHGCAPVSCGRVC